MKSETPRRRRRPRPLATVMIRDASKLNALGRRTLGAWQRRQGDAVEKHGTVYATTFKARYR